ncbi:MAG: dolichol-phosphate mannosyltransferase [Nitrospira bacterium SG8_35_1]|nr:MAG: dolichol-phosphate mannosyltransferase [Nitrospira bacterium SG8_35_1]
MSNRVNQEKHRVGQTYFVLPAYNEEGSLPNLLNRIASLQQKTSDAIKVLVVDDGSTDNTASIVKEGITGLDVRLISHNKNMGLGQAVQTGIKEALNVASDNDIIIIMDADDSHDVNLLDSMKSKIRAGADIVIASRFVEGGDDSSAPLFRRFLSRGAIFVFRTFLPLEGINDFTSGYRAYRLCLLRIASSHWGERLIEEQGFACMVELLLKLRHWSPAIEEVPMNLRYDRKQSASKMKLGRTLSQYLKLFFRNLLAPPPRESVCLADLESSE